MSPVVSVSLFVCWLSLLLQLCRISPWSVVTSLAANYGDTVTPVTTIVPAARPCHCKTNGDSSRVRAVTTTSRQISCSHSLCQDDKTPSLTLTRPNLLSSRGASHTPGTRAAEATYGHYITTWCPPTLRAHTAYSKYINTNINSEFIWYINRIFVFATNIWWYCCGPIHCNVVTKLRNAKYVFVHLHSVFDCPSPSHSATHFFCWLWRK